MWARVVVESVQLQIAVKYHHKKISQHNAVRQTCVQTLHGMLLLQCMCGLPSSQTLEKFLLLSCVAAAHAYDSHITGT